MNFLIPKDIKSKQAFVKKAEEKQEYWYFFSLNDKNARRKINNLLQTIKKQIDV